MRHKDTIYVRCKNNSVQNIKYNVWVTRRALSVKFGGTYGYRNALNA
jgi:hypothetical protein